MTRVSREPQARLTRQIAVRLRTLPAPDALDLAWPEGYVCLVAGTGTALDRATALHLQTLGWPVVLLYLPGPGSSGTPTDAPGDLPAASAGGLDEHDVEQAVAQVVERYGPVAVTVYLHPPVVETPAQDQRLVRAAFLLAKHLHPHVTTVPAPARAAFMTVMRLDGALGLGGGGAFSAVVGGLPGLAKTLWLEWRGVFCRALDLAPTMAPDNAAAIVAAELHDPDQGLVEVGYGAPGRVTLAAPVGDGGIT